MSALIGFIARFPHAFTHTCDRMSVSTRDVNPAAAECLRDGSDPLGSRAVELSQRETITFDEADDPGLVPFGGRIGDAAR